MPPTAWPVARSPVRCWLSGAGRGRYRPGTRTKVGRSPSGATSPTMFRAARSTVATSFPRSIRPRRRRRFGTSSLPPGHLLSEAGTARAVRIACIVVLLLEGVDRPSGASSPDGLSAFTDAKPSAPACDSAGSYRRQPRARGLPAAVRHASAPATPATIAMPIGVLPVSIAAAPPMAMQPPARKVRSLVSDFIRVRWWGPGRPTGSGSRGCRRAPRAGIESARFRACCSCSGRGGRCPCGRTRSPTAPTPEPRLT
jgi:hypothetical protein